MSSILLRFVRLTQTGFLINLNSQSRGLESYVTYDIVDGDKPSTKENK